MRESKFSIVTSNKTVYYISFIVLNLFIIFVSMLASVIITGNRVSAGIGLPIVIIISYIIMCVISKYKTMRIIIQSTVYLILVSSIFTFRFRYIPQIESYSIMYTMLEVIIGLIFSSYLAVYIYEKLAQTRLFRKVYSFKKSNTLEDGESS